MISAFTFFTGAVQNRNQSLELSYNIDILDSTDHGNPIQQLDFIVIFTQGDNSSDVTKKIIDAAIIRAGLAGYTLNKKDILTLAFTGSL